MIDEIIDTINIGFAGIHESGKILGISQPVYRLNSEDANDYMPGIVKLGEDEAIYAGIDDVDSLMIYHKLNNSTLSFAPRSGYGDSRLSEDNVLASIIAAWDTRKIKVYSADMLLLLRSRMPQQIAGIQDIHQVNIIPNNALLNTKQIFESEYKFDKAYLLPIYMTLIQINYTIQIKYDQACIEKCINCSN